MEGVNDWSVWLTKLHFALYTLLTCTTFNSVLQTISLSVVHNMVANKFVKVVKTPLRQQVGVHEAWDGL